MEHICVNRKSIEKKLAELLKLCRRDRFENHFAIENFRRRRIKLKNIIKEYTELLQQPLMEFLGSGTNQQNIKAVPFEVTKAILDIISNQPLTWLCNWTLVDTSIKLGKRRALSDLLKLLESLGLKKHRTSVERQFGKSESWLLQPSYKVQHFLPTQSEHSSGNMNVGFSNLKSSSPEVTWKIATEYYFKSIASAEYLEEYALIFIKILRSNR
ncbi:hypothetical protein OROHE_006222 [Orobanche hederae]